VPVETPQVGLVLTGGGARSAYQVGVLKGVAELLRRGSACPFPIITGTSAGAVSAIALASDAAHFRRSVYAIERVWRDFRVHQVFKADAISMLRSGMHWMLAFATGGWLVHPPHSMFDNTPLWNLLRGHLHFDGIPRGLYKGHLGAIGICATCYGDVTQCGRDNCSAQCIFDATSSACRDCTKTKGCVDKFQACAGW